MKTIIISILIILSMAVSIQAVVSHSASEIVPGTFQVGSYTFPGIITFQSAIDMSSSRITNMAEPTAGSDAATKSYVDASGGSDAGYANTGKGVEYLGLTTSTYTGNLGGVIGAGTKCEGDYGDGARMMTTADIETLGADASTAGGWYHCSDSAVAYVGTYIYYYCGSAYRQSDIYNYDKVNCNGWSVNSNYYRGGYSPSIYGSSITCDSNYKIHCVRDIYDSYFDEGGEPYFCSRKAISQNGKTSDSAINKGRQCLSSPETYCLNGSCNGILNDTYIIYVTSATTTGAMGGREGADEFCNNNMPSGVLCGDVHAFLSINTNDEIQDIPSVYYPGFNDSLPIYWGHSTTGALTKMAENFTDMLDSSILVSQSTGTGSNTYTHTFSNADGTLQTNGYTCGGGTSTIGNGANSYPYAVNTQWLYYSASACTGNRNLRCFCRGME